jgi:Xaa-Pro aminopeptidase
MTRTVFLGEPPPKFKQIYQIVREAQISAIESVRPGMGSDEADAVARDIIKKAGFGSFFGHSLGHGVGLATHEKPSLGPLKPRELKEGMVFTIEPGIYIPGKGGVRLEEMILLERDGARLLTKGRHFYSF